MLIPATRYRDCVVALVFLRDMLGLEEHVVHRGADGTLDRVEMKTGTGLTMFGPKRTGSAFDAVMVPPDEVGQRETTTIYAVVQSHAELEQRYAMAAGT